MTTFAEATVEAAALVWLARTGRQIRNGAEIAPGEPAAERDDYGQVVLAQRLRDALPRLNSALSTQTLEDALHKLPRREAAAFVVRSRPPHRKLVDCVRAMT